ncbi:putative F-box protein At2g19630 [Capsella rubella]|uniref:putative F-box protein At2g19630 n=1 Tax=Capsella rubella TaxID=81985 RepID=UPI000CD5A41B|nr:putative F-box protein At2g19630 [Capsella rubella]
MKRQKLLASSSSDPLTISKCNTPSSSSYSPSDSLPPDVFMEIISKLPAKTIRNCRRVSKSWAAALRRSEFDELFLNNSRIQPLILFAFVIDGGLPFFTVPQVHEVDTFLDATRHNTYLPIDRFSQITPPVRGLLCIEDKRRMIVVCNPITCESVTLPKLESNMMWSKTILGYDPVEKQFKVFNTAWSPHHPLNTHGEHYVLTLGTGKKMVWRMIECSKPFRPVFDGGICIDGVLYYVAKLNCCPEDVVIVCFDVRFEKFSFLNKPKGMRQIQYGSRLVNYKGQLGIVHCSNSRKINGGTKSFDLWILEDVKEQRWTKHVYVLPLVWRIKVANTKLRILGMTGTCEIVLCPCELSDPYYIVYYNIETNSVKKIGIRGLGSFEASTTIAHLFVNYVEDVKFI